MFGLNNKKKSAIVKFSFSLPELSIEEKIDLLFDHLMSDEDSNIEDFKILTIKINVESLDILKKKSYYPKLRKIE